MQFIIIIGTCSLFLGIIGLVELETRSYLLNNCFSWVKLYYTFNFVVISIEINV